MKNASLLLILLICGLSMYSCKDNNGNDVKMGASLSQSDSAILHKGEVIIGAEVSVFVIENGSEYWLSGNLDEIEEKYNKLTKGKPAYTPVYAELKGIKLPVAEDGFASEYDGVFEVTEVIVLGSSENLEK